MILIGTMNLTRTRERGNFYCPTCAINQPYRLRARRPFLTVYFIPTVPVGGAELFVQCDQCKSAWDVSVLDMDKSSHRAAAEQQFRDEAVRSAVLVVLADNVISEQEISSLRVISSRLLERPVDREELGRICSAAEQNRIQAKNYVLTVSRGWSQEQKRTALQAMFLAATSGGELGEAQLTTLAELRDILGLTENEYHAAIEEALTWEQVD